MPAPHVAGLAQAGRDGRDYSSASVGLSAVNCGQQNSGRVSCGACNLVPRHSSHPPRPSPSPCVCSEAAEVQSMSPQELAESLSVRTAGGNEDVQVRCARCARCGRRGGPSGRQSPHAPPLLMRLASAEGRAARSLSRSILLPAGSAAPGQRAQMLHGGPKRRRPPHAPPPIARRTTC